MIRFVDEHKDRIGVDPIVGVLRGTNAGFVSLAGYYTAIPRPPSVRSVADDRTVRPGHTSRTAASTECAGASDAKSWFGSWANEMPEAGQGPAVGSATFTNLRLTDNYQDIRDTTSTFTINRN